MIRGPTPDAPISLPFLPAWLPLALLLASDGVFLCPDFSVFCGVPMVWVGGASFFFFLPPSCFFWKILWNDEFRLVMSFVMSLAARCAIFRQKVWNTWGTLFEIWVLYGDSIHTYPYKKLKVHCLLA